MPYGLERSRSLRGPWVWFGFGFGVGRILEQEPSEEWRSGGEGLINLTAVA
jgi:hypothetical protein